MSEGPPGPTGLLARVRASRPARALAHRNLRLYLAGQGSSLIGTWMQRVGVGWLAWELTHSGFWLGALAAADVGPSLLLAPLAGAVADRFDRQRLGMLFQSIALAQAAVLALLAFAGRVDIGTLLVFQAAQGIATAFWQPARFALIPSLVPREDLTTTIALTAVNFNLARFIGPALAGPVILGLGVWATFALNAASYLAFLVAASRLTLPPRPAPPAVRANVLAEALSGVTRAARDPGIGPLLLFASLFALTVRPLAELLPGFAALLGGGAGRLAAMTAAMGAGALIAGGILAAAVPRRALSYLLVAGIALAALALLLFLFAPGFTPALLCLALLALCETFVGVSAQTLLQLRVTEDMRGRMLSLYGLIVRGGPALGALVLGLASEAAGLRLPVALGALGALGVALAAALTRRRWASAFDPAASRLP